MQQTFIRSRMTSVSHATHGDVQLFSWVSTQIRKAEPLTEFCWEARLKVDMLATRPAAMLPTACAKAIRTDWNPSRAVVVT
jgi:hypothetical protein